MIRVFAPDVEKSEDVARGMQLSLARVRLRQLVLVLAADGIVSVVEETPGLSMGDIRLTIKVRDSRQWQKENPV